MDFAGDISKTSKWGLLHLKEILYWHKAGSGIQETFNRMKVSGKKNLVEMDTDTIEVWTTTLLALAMQHREEKIFWLGKPKNDPPDMAIMTVTEKGFFHARELEVTRCMQPDKELMNNVLKKDQENSLSDNYILCGFVEVPGRYDLVAIGRDLQTRLQRVKNVVLVFNGTYLADPHERFDESKAARLWTVAQITPVFDAITIDIETEYKQWLNDPDKLRYTKNGKIYAGKRAPNEAYPTLLADTPLTV